MIDATTDHFIICGYGRVGRQVARDLRAAGARYVVIDPVRENRDTPRWGCASSRARRRATRTCAAPDRARASGDRLRRLRRREHLHRADRARAQPRGGDRRALGRRALREQAAARRRRPRDLALQVLGRGDGALALHPQVSGAIDVADDHRLEEISVSPGCEGVGQDGSTRSAAGHSSSGVKRRRLVRGPAAARDRGRPATS